MIGVVRYAGPAVLLALWSLPVGDWTAWAFPGHMLRHMGLVAIAAPLLVIGWPWLGARFAVSPLAAAVVEFLVVWGWHLPRAHGAAWTSLGGLIAEQAMFLLAGIAVWAGALRGAQPLAGAGGLLLTSMHMTLLGTLLILAPRDLYAEFCGTPPNLSGQQLGGILMLGIGTPAYLLGGLWLVRRALDDREAWT